MADSHGEAGITLASEDDRKYARLGVRIRAAIYDSILLVIAFASMLPLAISLGSDGPARVFGAVVVLLLVLYEPVMVWAKGGTLGHIACNLRVVDDRTLGNPSFLRAISRFAVKAALGWFSFVTMMASRRLRAIHDMLAGSTVQIRNAGHVRKSDFAPAYSEPDNGRKPSRIWRMFSMLVYLIFSVAVFILIVMLLEAFEVLSTQCIDSDRCSNGEELIFTVLGLGWLVSLFVIIGFGWRGRLFGFRKR